MGNRKERRAAKGADSATSIPLAQADRTQPQQKAKSLFDLAAERNKHLAEAGSPQSADGKGTEPQLIHKIINPDGSLSEGEPSESAEDLIGPLGNAIFYAVSLTMVHLTLDVLVHNQYAERIKWDDIGWQTLKTFPSLLIMVYLLHPRANEIWAQGIFLVGSIAAGCHLSYISSESSMFAVMKAAPPVGTLWVWAVLEQRLEYAVLGLISVGGYFWWKEYTIF